MSTNDEKLDKMIGTIVEQHELQTQMAQDAKKCAEHSNEGVALLFDLATRQQAALAGLVALLIKKGVITGAEFELSRTVVSKAIAEKSREK